MASRDYPISNFKIHKGTYQVIYDNLASIGENELIITTDKNVPVPQVADSGKVVKVNASGEYELASATDVDTWRAIKVDGVEKLASNSNTALDLVAGTNITLTESSGAVTIAASGGTPTSISNSTINALFGYAITTTISNGSASGATFIYNGETATITITPATGYVAPSSVTISNATQVSYDSSTGVLVIGSATDDVTITGACEQPSGVEITMTLTSTDGGTSPVYVYDQENGNLLYTFSQYYSTETHTVETQTGQLYICGGNTGSIDSHSETGNVTYVNMYNPPFSSGQEAWILYSVTGAGTITISFDLCYD